MADIIETIEQERRKLEVIGERQARKIARSLKLDVITAFSAGVRDFTPIVIENLAPMQPLLNDNLTAAHLMGMRRTVILAEPAVMKQAKFGVYEESINFASDRLDLSTEQVVAIEGAYKPMSTQATINITNEVNTKLLTSLKASQELGDTVPMGVDRLRTALNGVTGELRKAHVLATLFRTNTQLAFSAGRWQASQDSVINDLLWGYRYRTVGDGRVRDNHRLLDNTTLPKNHPRWNSIWPPNGFNCRCTTIEIYEPTNPRDVQAGRVINGQMVEPIPDVGFDFNAGKTIGAKTGSLPIIKKAKPKPPRKKKKTQPKPIPVAPPPPRTVAPVPRVAPKAVPVAAPAPRRRPPVAKPVRVVKPTPKPVKAPKTVSSATLQRRVTKAENNLVSLSKGDRAKQIEYAEEFDINGNSLGVRRGGKNKVTVTQGEVKKWKKAGGLSTMTHNHPSGTSFSNSDIKFMFDINNRAGLKEFRVVSNIDKRRYIMKPKKKITDKQANAIVRKKLKIEDEIMKKRRIKIRDEVFAAGGKQTAAQGRAMIQKAVFEDTHDAMVELQKEFSDLFEYERILQ